MGIDNETRPRPALPRPSPLPSLPIPTYFEDQQKTNPTNSINTSVFVEINCKTLENLNFHKMSLIILLLRSYNINK